MSESPDNWHLAIAADRVPPGQARPVQVAGEWLAICNDGGTFHAIDNACPHAGGPLGNGDVHDGCIVCPIHGWPFELATGLTDPNMPWVRVKRYPCEVRDGQVYIRLTPLPPQLPDQPA